MTTTAAPNLSDQFEAAWDSGSMTGAPNNSPATTPLVAGQWIAVGQILVPAGTVFALGAGQLGGQDSAVGRFYLDARDNTVAPGAEIDGMLRWQLVDPQGRPRAIAWQGSTRQLRTTLADRRQQFPYKVLSGFAASWQWTLQLLFDAETVGDGTWSWANTVLLVSYTSWLTQVMS